MIKRPFWFIVLMSWSVLDLNFAGAIEMDSPPMHMDKTLQGLEKLYGNCRKRNIILVQTRPTKFPAINLDIEKIEEGNKFETTQILYNLYYLCLQENNELLGVKKRSF